MDIHEARLRLDALERMASHDTLTRLLNIDYAERRIEERLSAGGEYVLMLLDVDNIKEANDSRGRMFGDQVLTHVAEILRQNTGEGDIAARVSGDEFLYFAKSDSDREQTVDRLMAALQGEWEGFKISVCMGIVSVGNGKKDYTELFMKADRALLEAKKDGPGQRRYKNE